MKTVAKTEVNKGKILHFLLKHPNSDAKKIEKATGIAFIQVYSIAGKLQKENQVVIKNKLFSLTNAAKREAKKTTNFGRDFSKYTFNGIKLRKGQLVLAIVSDFANKHKCTAAQLRKAFPDELVPMYGVFADVAEARRASVKRQRYFTAPDQVIKLKDKTNQAVTNQISLKNFPGFLDAAKKAGYVVK